MAATGLALAVVLPVVMPERRISPATDLSTVPPPLPHLPDLLKAPGVITPDDTTFLDLSLKNLSLWSVEQIVAMFGKISEDITSISLKHTGFESKTAEEQAQIVAATPPWISSLNLSWNYFNRLGIQFALVLAAIPGGVKCLNLGGNYLGSLSVEELVIIFKALPSGVQKLDLRRSIFYNKSDWELKQIIAALPDTVTEVAFNEKGYMPRATCWEGVSTRVGFFAGLNKPQLHEPGPSRVPLC